MRELFHNVLVADGHRSHLESKTQARFGFTDEHSEPALASVVDKICE
jgi:hypothetical protein